MAIDGFELDVPDTPANAAAFGYASGGSRSAFPKVRVVTIGECGSHAKIAATGAALLWRVKADLGKDQADRRRPRR